MINKRLNNRLGITARQFNAKITRLSKLNATLPKDQKFKLPSRMNLKSIRKEMTANEVRREIKRANIFLRKGAENAITTRGGVTVPRYEYFGLKQELRWNIKYHNTRFNKLANRKSSRGGISGPTFRTIGHPYLYTSQAYIQEESEDLKYIGDYNIKQFNNLKRRYSGRIDAIERREAQYTYNFIDKMLDSYSDVIYGTEGDFIDGSYKGKIEYIKSKLQKLTIDELEDLMETEEYVHTLASEYRTFLYEMETGKAQLTLNPLISDLYKTVDKIVQGYISRR